MDTTEHPRTRTTPTPEEIRAACAEIRAGWTEETEANRRTVRNTKPKFDRPKTLHWDTFDE